MTAKSTALVPVDPALMPAPLYGASAMSSAFREYQRLQQALDEAMPDQILKIEGRPFRKKGYWRGVATAFNLTLDLVQERREVHGTFEDGHDNFVYFVLYRATTPTGRSSVGDGSCAALEKASRREANKWRLLPWQATEHNIRAHAHTRAFNRAVSSLVGFGEVSAEELERDDDHEPPPPPIVAAAAPSPPPPRRQHPDSKPITVPMVKRMFAMAREHGWTDKDALKETLRAAFGIESTTLLAMADYEQACDIVRRGPPLRVVPEEPIP